MILPCDDLYKLDTMKLMPPKGHHQSPETRARISAAKVGVPRSMETKAKLSAAMKGRHPTEETRAKMRASNRQGRGETNTNWKGGRTIDSHGYVWILLPDHPHSTNGYILEHRVVMEHRLGRYLDSDEHVHHVNEQRDDNRDDNLELTCRSEHSRHHRLKEVADGKGSAWDRHKSRIQDKPNKTTPSRSMQSTSRRRPLSPSRHTRRDSSR